MEGGGKIIPIKISVECYLVLLALIDAFFIFRIVWLTSCESFNFLKLCFVEKMKQFQYALLEFFVFH